MACALLAMAGNAHERIVCPRLLDEEGRDASLARLGHAGDERPVDFSRRARAEGLGQRRGGKPRLGDEQAPRGILVEAVHQARALAVGIAQRFEHSIDMTRGARAALHRKPHGLVEHQHVGIFVERDGFEEIPRLVARLRVTRRRPRLQSQRRDTHGLPGLEALARLRALAIHAQLALSDDSLDVGKRESRKARLHETVDAHAGFVRTHLCGLYAGRSRRAFAVRLTVHVLGKSAHGRCISTRGRDIKFWLCHHPIVT